MVRYHRAMNDYSTFNRLIKKDRKVTEEKIVLKEIVEDLNKEVGGCCKRSTYSDMHSEEGVDGDGVPEGDKLHAIESYLKLPLDVQQKAI